MLWAITNATDSSIITWLPTAFAGPTAPKHVCHREAEREVTRIHEETGERGGDRVATGGNDAHEQELGGAGEHKDRQEHRQPDRKAGADGNRPEREPHHPVGEADQGDVARQVCIEAQSVAHTGSPCRTHHRLC